MNNYIDANYIYEYEVMLCSLKDNRMEKKLISHLFIK